jgi:hypothetical protein
MVSFSWRGIRFEKEVKIICIVQNKEPRSILRLLQPISDDDKSINMGVFSPSFAMFL